VAGDWIKIESVTPDKPEIFVMAEHLHIDPDAVLGKLLRIWIWADQHTEDGNAAHLNRSIIDRISGEPHFAEAMESAGWLIESDAGIEIPNFDKHNGQSAKRRANTAKRVSKSRNASVTEMKRSCNADVTDMKHKKVTLPRPIVRKIMERDGKTCVYCGRKEGEYSQLETSRDGLMSIDHVIPESRNGSNEPDNLVVSCLPCNNFKNNRTPEEAGLPWPEDESGKRYGSVTESVTHALPREEKRREDKETSKDVSMTQKPKRFVKPTLAEVTAYCLERGNSVNPESFIDHYESKGWKVGTAPMKDWKAAVRQWERNPISRGSPKPQQFSGIQSWLNRKSQEAGNGS